MQKGKEFMPEPQTEKAKPAIEYVGADASSIYVNSTEMGISPWDVRIKMGEIVGQAEDGRPQVKHLGTLLMAPAHAKAVLEALQKTVNLYEEKFGEIDLAKIRAGSAISPQ
jgi:hypothetical protein